MLHHGLPGDSTRLRLRNRDPGEDPPGPCVRRGAGTQGETALVRFVSSECVGGFGATGPVGSGSALSVVLMLIHWSHRSMKERSVPIKMTPDPEIIQCSLKKTSEICIKTKNVHKRKLALKTQFTTCLFVLLVVSKISHEPFNNLQ